MRRRLSLLSIDQLQKIIDTPEGQICLDTFNYDAVSGNYCPLAIALDIPDKVSRKDVQVNQELVLEMIKDQAGKAWGSVKGIPGEFYTKNRYKDILNAKTT